MSDFLLIIDGSSLLSTQFFGNLPREVLMGKTMEDKEKYFYKIMKTSKGVYTNGVFGFLRTLFSIMDKQKPKYLAITWDLTRDTFRRELYSDYKANRSETMIPLKNQFALCQEVLNRMGIKQFMDVKYEADDFSGSIAKKFGDEVDIRIMTKDHDYLQLVKGNTKLWLIVSDQTKADDFFKRSGINKEESNVPEKSIILDADHVKSEFGVYPKSIPSLKGLMGDTADNIKGVPGIGDKTATALISHYESIDNLYDEIHKINDAKELGAKWKEIGVSRNPYSFLTKESDEELVGEKAARLSEDLATIRCDLEINEELKDLELCPNYAETVKILEELEINTLKLPKDVFGESLKDEFFSEFADNLTVIDNLTLYYDFKDKIVSEAKDAPIGLALINEKDELSVGIAIDKKTYLVKCEGFIYEDLLLDLLNEVVKASSKIYASDYKIILKYTDSDKEFEDVSLIHYILNPLDTVHDGLKCAAITGHTPDKEYESAAISAHASLALYDEMYKMLGDNGLDKVYEEIDKPLIPILNDMEKQGIKCSVEELNIQAEELKSGLEECKNRIYELAGEEFNILSPKQLGVILFEKLGLKGGKKTKTGYSTSADILEKIRDQHEIIDAILNYRQLSKLMSTYIEGLKTCIGVDGRIHCNFKQTVTATGRLSCTDPNLQNIPVRDELGRRIRKAFIPEEGKIFVDADYSQIELRVMAHMAGDEKLIDDYKNARDIHQSTAASVFNVPYDEVTKKQRRDAKAVNFGIIYGISSFGLGQDLDISRKQAEEYIEAYFKNYPQIKNYLDNLVSEAKKTQQVRTLFGRIRPIPEISSTNYMERNFGERIAMNSPIQGTAADIMKIAMIKVYNALKKAGLKAKMLLQIHDEILIEAPASEREMVQKILIDEMTSAVELKVSLDAVSGYADNWYDLK